MLNTARTYSTKRAAQRLRYDVGASAAGEYSRFQKI